jgi:alpha-tubulin suppressor-like RCC1 family protein
MVQIGAGTVMRHGGGTRHGRAIAVAVVAVGLAAGSLAPAAAATTANAQKSVAVGEGFQCAVSVAGVVKCWGFNGSGAVGNGSTAGGGVTKPVAVLTGAVSVATGDNHTCAVLKVGTVKCWGQNDLGQIGIGSTVQNVWSPTSVKGVGGTGLLTGVVSLAAAGAHTCALLKTATVKCWGFNSVGTLGNGTNKTELTPVSVTGLQRVVTIAMSAQVACASLLGGSVKCWGYTGDGELGYRVDGPQDCEYGEFSHPCAETPMTVKGVSGAASVSVAQNHVCADLKTGKVECWGNNSVTPVIVRGLTGVTQLATNGTSTDHSCALLKTSTVSCFAYDTNTIKFAPRPVAGLSGAKLLAVGNNTDCAVLAAGTVKCWNDDGTTTTKPVLVTGL